MNQIQIKMKKAVHHLIAVFSFSALLLGSTISMAGVHIIRVWDGYFQFTPNQITVPLGDTIYWLPLDQPTMLHTITSTNIPGGAASFDAIWQAPADTFFQYVPTVAGLYIYECTPHATSFNMIGTFIVYPPVGLNDPDDNEPLQVYPNPVSEALYASGMSAGDDFRIYDQAGKLVFSGQFTGRIDVSGLNDGIYYLEHYGDVNRRSKFIVQAE